MPMVTDSALVRCNGEALNKYWIAGNNITNRGADVLEQLPSQRPSKNLTEAALKSLKLYRRCCRLVRLIPDRI